MNFNFFVQGFFYLIPAHPPLFGNIKTKNNPFFLVKFKFPPKFIFPFILIFYPKTIPHIRSPFQVLLSFPKTYQY